MNIHQAEFLHKKDGIDGSDHFQSFMCFEFMRISGAPILIDFQVVELKLKLRNLSQPNLDHTGMVIKFKV